MLKTIKSCELQGTDGIKVEVEVHVAKGHPDFKIIGLPDAAIREATIRIRTALKNVELPFPYTRRVIINLAPADIKKEGPSYDMAILAGILAAQVESLYDFSQVMMVGELSLNGEFRHVRGIISTVEFAKSAGCQEIFVPYEDRAEASLISGIKIFPVKSISQMLRHLIGEELIEAVEYRKIILDPDFNSEFNFSFIRGQKAAKRALEIAAAGMHNVLMSGPPGSGKTMLAQAMPTILPPMSEREMIEVTKLYSVSNLLPSGQSLITNRPFRSPHHTSSSVSLIGGGANPKPGEISLAHRGVLFLDEFPEFSRLALETLRQPLEDGLVTISRALTSVTYLSRFMLVASQNPCPCGYFSDSIAQCVCTPLAIARYKSKVSGPLLDRIDIQLYVPRLSYDELQKNSTEESSQEILKRVASAHKIQAERFSGDKIIYNSEMRQKQIKAYCRLDNESTVLLKHAVESMRLSARAYFRVLKLSRTIADLAGVQEIQDQHIAEALQYKIN